MTLAMQQTLLRRGCERLRQSLADCPDLPAGELFIARMATLAVIGLASRGPMLALPWNDKPQPDRKMMAGADDTFTNL